MFYPSQQTFDIFHDIRVAESQRAIAGAIEPSITTAVIGCVVVCPSIDLDDQPPRMDGEVDGVRADRDLPADVEAVAAPQFAQR